MNDLRPWTFGNPVRVLSIRQPWAWLIVNGYKDIENRDWYTNVRGPLLLQTGQRWDDDMRGQDAVDFFKEVHGIDVPLDLPTGGYVGITNLTDCVRQSDSKWFVGDFGLVMKDSRPCRFKRARGQLGIYGVPWSDVADILTDFIHPATTTGNTLP